VATLTTQAPIVVHRQSLATLNGRSGRPLNHRSYTTPWDTTRHREMKPVENMASWAGAGGLAERSWTIRTIAQDSNRWRRRRSQSMKHTAQLSGLRSRLRRNAGKYDLLPLIVADLSEENLERAPLVLTRRSHVAAVN
jgi:hypothetical protein